MSTDANPAGASADATQPDESTVASGSTTVDPAAARRAEKKREKAARDAGIKAMEDARTEPELRRAIERAESIGVGRAAIRKAWDRMKELQETIQEASRWRAKLFQAKDSPNAAVDMKRVIVDAIEVHWLRRIQPYLTILSPDSVLPCNSSYFQIFSDELIHGLDSAESEGQIQAAVDNVVGKYRSDQSASIWMVLPDPSRLPSEYYIGAQCGNPSQYLAEVDGDGALTAALNRARSRLEESQTLRQHEAERKAAGVNELMPERPTEHLCVITQQPMRNPVVAADGFTYERSAIERWLRSHDTSPKTNETLANETVRPNMDLKNLIRDWETREHTRCMAQAAPSLARQSTADLEAELERRKNAGSSSAKAAGKRKASNAAGKARKK